MVTVNEFTYDEAKDIVKALGGKLSADERVLIMDENGEKIGAAVIGLDRTVVEIRQLIVKDRPFPYFDLLARSTLNIINLFELPIMVRVENNPYFTMFGFKQEEDGFMYVRSDEITFKGSLCGGHK
ncbi:MAG: hypothetical protein E7350_04475 [Clostridiales bacterium]|nr:hypothetical protein [Clostridiales bacterium]